MRILYVVPDGEDLGGIITSSENLCAGFDELDHEVEFALLTPTKTPARIRAVPKDGYTLGFGTVMHMNPVYGWNWCAGDHARAYSMGDQSDRDLLRQKMQQVDMIVWGSVYGLNNVVTQGVGKKVFEDLFNHGIPSVVMIRDDHFGDRYPWAAMLEDYGVRGWAGVQACSVASCRGLKRPVMTVYSGHSPAITAGKPYAERRGVYSAQTAKSWKRVDLLVGAVPHMGIQVTISGDGIELRYMKSKDKCKPRYILPDGQHIWDRAIAYGMNYTGIVDIYERNEYLQNSRLLIDLSTRSGPGQINRIVVEAIANGCVPVCVQEFIGDNVFKPWIHYIPIYTRNKTYDEIAKQIDSAYATTDTMLEIMVGNGQKLLPMFDRVESARRLIKLALNSNEDKDPDSTRRAIAEASFNSLFGGTHE